MERPHILVVDDEPAILETMSGLLTRAECLCEPADSGKRALSLLREHEYHIMFSDISMPAGNGLELLPKARELRPDMPVIMLTGTADIGLALSTIRKGAYDFIAKPFSCDELLAVLHRALEYRRLKLENREYERQLKNMVAARTAEIRQALEAVKQSYDITLEALGDALDLKDCEARGHSKRVTAFSIAIARAMGLGASEICTLARGAFLHDIGKIAIPDTILRKPGPLDDHEREIVRGHCFRGYQILKSIPFLSQAAEIVYAHQESYDGTGYPRHLKGEDIPLGARICSVAQALDVITSNRPYRAARSLKDARQEIHNCSGRQFDPRVVNTFLGIEGNLWADLGEALSQQADLKLLSTG